MVRKLPTRLVDYSDIPDGPVQVTGGSLVAGSGGGGASGVYGWAFPGSSETVGEAATGTVSSTSYAGFTTTLSLGKPMLVTQVVWRVGEADTYTLFFDGVAIGSPVVASVAGPVTFTFATPVAFPPGTHSFAIKGTASRKHVYVGVLEYVDRWFKMSGWSEPGGNYHPCVRVTGTPGNFVSV